MRSLAATSLCAVLLLCSHNLAFAQYAVTDAGAYGYYAHQIQEQVEQINQIKAQTVGQFQRLEDIKTQLTSQFSGLKSIYGQLSGIKSVFDTKPTDLLSEAAKWATLKDATAQYTGLSDALADVFKDPRGTDVNVNKIAYVNRQYSMRQTALQNAITHADSLLKTVPDRLSAINAMQAAALAAKNQSEKQDVTNALLVEMLRTMTTYSSVLLEFNQAAALMNFTGADSNVTKIREQQIWNVKKTVEALAASKSLRNSFAGMGIDAGSTAKYSF